MSILSILLFFVYSYGMGYSLMAFFRSSASFFERHIMRVGVGLSVMTILTAFLGTLRIPLDWRLFLGLSLIVPLIQLVRGKIKPTFSGAEKEWKVIAILMLIFAFTLYTYEKGAFAYPWLEDDDPWAHAVGVKYVAMEKGVLEPIPGKEILTYMDAYPPGFDAILGILHQTAPSISWTMKFFNALIISLSVLFFFFFARHLFESDYKALFATFVLAMVPAYLSHFTWAISLAIPVFFVALYGLENARRHKDWKWCAGVLVAAVPLTQPTTGVALFGMLVLYYLTFAILSKKWINPIGVAVIVGLALSVVFWWGPVAVRYQGNFLSGFSWTTLQTSTNPAESATGKSYIGFLGSGTRPYTFGDYFSANKQNLINNPVGLGIIVGILVLAGIIGTIFLRKSMAHQPYVLIGLLWLLFAFFGVNGGTRWWAPIAFWSFRFWMLLAIAASIVAAVGLWMLFSFAKQLSIPRIWIVIPICVAIFLTSGIAKYAINTSTWGPGGLLMSGQGLTEGYLALKALPPDTKVYPMAMSDAWVIGMDDFSCVWCTDQIAYRNESFDYTAPQMSSWLRSHGYKYLILDLFYAQDYGAAKATERFSVLNASPSLFTPVHQTQGVLIYQVN